MKKINKTMLVLGAVTTGLVFAADQNKRIVKTQYRIKSEKIKRSIKIVHLSDFHSTLFYNLTSKILECKADIIVVTGDYINDKCRNKDKMLNYCRELSAVAPVYYIPGNHERRLENFEELMKQLSENGFNVLVNEEKEILLNDNNISILGLSEKQADKKDYINRMRNNFVYEDFSEELKNFEKSNCFKLLLCHFPENFEKIKELNYSQYDFDLMLCGHAHGGQFDLPLIGGCFAPGQGIFPKYTKGMFGEKSKMIVSRGLGNSEFPLRLFNHPEIVEITIEPVI